MRDLVLLNPSGVFPDVAIPADGRPVVAFRISGSNLLRVMFLEVDGQPTGTQEDIDCAMGDSTFARLIVALGSTWLAYRAFRGGLEQAVVRQVLPFSLGPERVLGPTFGNNPVCLSADGLVAWQDPTAGVVRGLRLSDGETLILRFEMRPTGLSHLDGDQPVFCDDNRPTEPAMWNPVRSGAVTVGEGRGQAEGLVAKVAVAPKDIRTGIVLPGACLNPRCADFGESIFAAASWTPGVGVQFLKFTPNDIPVAVPAPPIAITPRTKPEHFCTFFTFSNRPSSGYWTDYPQSLTMVPDAGAVATAAQYVPFIAGSGSFPDWEGRSIFDAIKAAGVERRVVALWCAPADDNPFGPRNAQTAELIARAEIAEWHKRFAIPAPPVMYYVGEAEVTRSDWFFPPSVGCYMPEFYFQGALSSIAEFDADLQRKVQLYLRRLDASKPWLPVYQAFNRWGPVPTDMRLIAEMQPRFFEATRRMPAAIGSAWFAMMRTGGAKDHPEIEAYHREMFAAIPEGLSPSLGRSTPAPVVTPPVDPPPVDPPPVDPPIDPPVPPVDPPTPPIEPPIEPPVEPPIELPPPVEEPPPPPPPPGRVRPYDDGSCVTVRPGADWTCDKGSWYPPNMPIPSGPPPPVDPPVPPVEPPMMQPPKITISEPTFPVSGTAPLKVRCVYAAEPGSGPVAFIEWWHRGSDHVTRTVVNPGADPDHTFTFPTAGTYEIGAVGVNAAGRHPTGKKREVVVTAVHVPPSDPPVTEPTPEKGFTLRTDHGNFITVKNGVLAAGADPAQFKVERVGTDKIAFIVVQPPMPHPYVRAVNGGGGELRVDRDNAGPDEAFTVHIVRASSGAFALGTRTGQFASVEKTGRVIANRTIPDLTTLGGWEILTPSFAPFGSGGGGHVRVRNGAVRLCGRALCDDDGPFNALGASLFWAAWGYTHDRERLEENLSDLAKGGFHYIRVLADVGPDGWTDRETDPAWADYEGLTDLAFDTYGLRVQWTIFGGSRHVDSADKRRALVDRFIALANSRPQKVLSLEIANEFWQTFPGGDVAEVRALGRRAADATSTLVALSAAPDGLDLGATCRLYAGSGVDVATLHYDRDPRDHGFRPSRQPWGYPGEYEEQGHCSGQLPKAAFNNEPRGPKSSVAETSDPLLIAVDYVTTFIAGNAAYVLHTGAGVRGGGVEDRAKGRVPNIREEPQDVFAALSAAQGYLPAGLAGWERHNAQWASFPFDGGYKRAVEDGTLVRAFVATKDAEFVAILLGVSASVTAAAKRPLAFDVLHPTTGAVLRSVRLAGEEAWTLSAFPRTRDGSAGAVVLKGRFE